MALSIPNTTIPAGTGFTTLFTGGTPYSAGYLYVFNAAVEVSVLRGNMGENPSGWGPPLPASTGIFPVAGGTPSETRPRPEMVFGLQVRQLTGSSPVKSPQVFGSFFQQG